jgi:hypothetical protein
MHGISDDDIRHAIDNAIAAITRPEQPDFTMLIGPDATQRLACWRFASSKPTTRTT